MPTGREPEWWYRVWDRAVRAAHKARKSEYIIPERFISGDYFAAWRHYENDVDAARMENALRDIATCNCPYGWPPGCDMCVTCIARRTLKEIYGGTLPVKP